MPQKDSNRVTLGDIAHACGVSRATVSRALKDSALISESVRKEIKKRAADMGYQPDPEASRLMSYLKRSRKNSFQSVLGILNAYQPLSAINKDRYTMELLRGARERAAALGYTIDDLNLGESGMKPHRIDQIIKARSIQGVLVPPEPDPLFKVELDCSQISLVATTTTLLPVHLHRVLPSNFYNMRLLLDEAIRMGYKRIGYLHWDDLEQRQMETGLAIYSLYAYEQKRFEKIPPFSWDWNRGGTLPKRFKRWFTTYKPDCILGFGRLALNTITEITEAQAPRDFGYISYGEAEPGISRIDQRPAHVGSAAVDLLSAHCQRSEVGPPSVPKVLLIEGEFVADATTCQQ